MTSQAVNGADCGFLKALTETSSGAAVPQHRWSPGAFCPPSASRQPTAGTARTGASDLSSGARAEGLGKPRVTSPQVSHRTLCLHVVLNVPGDRLLGSQPVLRAQTGRTEEWELGKRKSVLRRESGSSDIQVPGLILEGKQQHQCLQK